MGIGGDEVDIHNGFASALVGTPEHGQVVVDGDHGVGALVVGEVEAGAHAKFEHGAGSPPAQVFALAADAHSVAGHHHDVVHPGEERMVRAAHGSTSVVGDEPVFTGQPEVTLSFAHV